MRPRFFLFEGIDYEQQGGLYDYVRSFEDIQSVIDYVDRPDRNRNDWWQIATQIGDDLVPVLERDDSKRMIIKSGRPFLLRTIGQWTWKR